MKNGLFHSGIEPHAHYVCDFLFIWNDIANTEMRLLGETLQSSEVK